MQFEVNSLGPLRVVAALREQLHMDSKARISIEYMVLIYGLHAIMLLLALGDFIWESALTTIAPC